MTAAPLRTLIRAVADETLTLTRAIEAAEEVQWQAAPIPRPSDDTTERSKGGHSDPVPSIVADPRRLAVRAEVVGAHVALEEAAEAFRVATGRLNAAVARWEGN